MAPAAPWPPSSSSGPRAPDRPPRRRRPAAGQAVADPARYVDTLIGSSNSGETFAGAVTPFGMVQWSPENTRGDQTRTPEPGGYSYDATRIRGFRWTSS